MSYGSFLIAIFESCNKCYINVTQTMNIQVLCWGAVGIDVWWGWWVAAECVRGVGVWLGTHSKMPKQSEKRKHLFVDESSSLHTIRLGGVHMVAQYTFLPLRTAMRQPDKCTASPVARSHNTNATLAHTHVRQHCVCRDIETRGSDDCSTNAACCMRRNNSST